MINPIDSSISSSIKSSIDQTIWSSLNGFGDANDPKVVVELLKNLLRWVDSDILTNFLNILLKYGTVLLLDLTNKHNLELKKRLDSVITPLSSDEMMKSISLQYADKLMDDVKFRVHDFVLDMFNQRLFRDNFIPFNAAAESFQVSLPTMQSWIDEGLVDSYLVGDCLLVSCDSIRRTIRKISNALSDSEVDHVNKLKVFIKNRKF